MFDRLYKELNNTLSFSNTSKTQVFLVSKIEL